MPPSYFLPQPNPPCLLPFTLPATAYHVRVPRQLPGRPHAQASSRDVALYLSHEIGAMDAFTLWSDGSDIPVFAWQLTDGHTQNWNLHHLSERLRMNGWLVPAYPLPDGLSGITVQRIGVRNGFTRDLAASFLADLKKEVAYLDALTRAHARREAEGSVPPLAVPFV